MKKRRAATKFPKGWDEARVRRVIAHYDKQTEDEAVAEYESAGRGRAQTVMSVPTKIVPLIRELIAQTAHR
jgi:hypothetical protein